MKKWRCLRCTNSYTVEIKRNVYYGVSIEYNNILGIRITGKDQFNL